MSLVALLIGVALGQVGPAAASPMPAPQPPLPAAPAQVASAAPQPDQDPVICQSMQVTGTRFTQRQCMTKSQWAKQARDSQDEYEGLNFGGGWGMGGGGGPH